jgi:hypothetical protein
MPENAADPLVRLTELIANRIRRTRYAEHADDVAHDVYCEIRRQAATREFVEMYGDRILGGEIPGLLWRRARAKARAMKFGPVQFGDAVPIDAVDETASHDSEVLISELDAEELCNRIPLFRRLLVAEREGLTREQFRKNINISKRRYYFEIRRARMIFGED